MKIAVVTGGLGGIGFGIAKALTENGYTVVASDVAPRAAGEEKLQSMGLSATYIPCDISKTEDRAALLAETLEKFEKVDLLVNVAGVAPKVRMDILQTTEESFDFVMNINCKGTYFMCQSALKYLRKSDHATIINISSVMGHNAYADQSAYIASKHAVHGMTKGLAKEVYKDGVRCHIISPGGVYTDMVKISRPDLSSDGMILPNEVAEVVSFLLINRGNAVIDEVRVHRVGKEPF